MNPHIRLFAAIGIVWIVGCAVAAPTTSPAHGSQPTTRPAVPPPQSLQEAIARFGFDPRLTLCHVWETPDGSLAGFVECPEHRALLAEWLKRDVSKIKLLPEESATKDRFGIVTAEHALLRDSPTDRPGDRDNVSDLTGGEPVWILDRHADGATLVHSSDGYLGWVEASAIRAVPGSAIAKWTQIPSGFTSPPPTISDDEQKRRPGVHTILGPEQSAQPILDEAKTFLGTPYVWGGKTKAGIDCSGLTQVSFGHHGILLPRDADQQSNVGRLVATRWFKDALLPGDLMFFMSPDRGHVHHVAIYLGDGKYIEAAGEGVRTRSMTPGDADYDPVRAATFCWARRVID